jgi:hypothetical protein
MSVRENPGWCRASLILVVLLASASELPGQARRDTVLARASLMPRGAHSVRPVEVFRSRAAASQIRQRRNDEELRRWSRYAGWGGGIGAAAGAVYFHTTTRSEARGLATLGGAALGFGAGVVGGTAVFVGRSIVKR